MRAFPSRVNASPQGTKKLSPARKGTPSALPSPESTFIAVKERSFCSLYVPARLSSRQEKYLHSVSLRSEPPATLCGAPLPVSSLNAEKLMTCTAFSTCS